MSACVKLALSTYAAAATAAKRHRGNRCGRCKSGMRFQPYFCKSIHRCFHVGHTVPGGWRW